MALGKRKAFNTPHRKRRIFWRRIIVGSTSFVVLAGMCALVLYGTRLPMFTVENIVVEGVETVPETEVRSRADSMLAGAYYGLIPRRFALTAPIERITENVQSIARVASATVERQGRTLIVSVREHSPDMLWCSDASQTSTCYYVDHDGIAYERAPALSGSALMRFVTDNTAPSLGAELLKDTDRRLLFDIASILGERHGFRINRINYLDTGDAELHITGGGRIIVSTRNDLNDTYTNLSSVLSTEQYAHLAPGGFEYIDLRFGNKVFVQKEKPISTTTASTTSGVE